MARGRNRRPGDGDRRRYTELLDAARAEGRLDDAELSRRSFTVRYAQTMAELDAVVEDLPVPAAATRSRAPVLVAVAALTAAGVLGFVLATSGDGDPGEPAADPPVSVVDPPPVAEEVQDVPPDMFSTAELVRMWDALDGLPVAGVRSIYLHAEWADLEVQTAPGARTYDDIEYDGAPGELAPGGQISEDDPDAVFFPLGDVDPAVVAACAAGAAEIADRPDRDVELVVISRSSAYGGIVTIDVHLEADAYGVSSTLTWDHTGRHLLDDGRDE